MNTLNLDYNLMPLNSPIAERKGVPPWKLGADQRLQQNRIITSQINIKDFIQISGTASATGTIENGTTLFLNTSLIPQPPHQTDVNFADAYIAIYQGTASIGSLQIYPTTGAGITPGAYTVQGGLDYHGLATASPQALSIWKGIITDNSAGNQTILFATVWKWALYNSGTVT